jgi:hypothetical protein
MLAASAAHPAYARLWWRNDSLYTMQPPAVRVEGPLIPAAPAHLVAALGALDRKLYVVPDARLLAVRMGPAATDSGLRSAVVAAAGGRARAALGLSDRAPLTPTRAHSAPLPPACIRGRRTGTRAGMH